MPVTQPHTLPFVLFRLQGNLYGISSQAVREIVNVPKVVSVPNAPKAIRGVINLRGKVMKLLDLRAKLGLPSSRAELEELVQLLHAREQDHRNWLNELEACVREQRPFKLARDPHQCKFGQWYDAYQTDNVLLRMVLEKMDQPHQLIHASAAEVLGQAEKGDLEGALALLEARRHGELATLVNLFTETRVLLQEQYRDLAIVLAQGQAHHAICIDSVEAVERISEENIESLPAALAGLSPELQCRVGKRHKTNETILLLDESSWLATAG